MTKFYYTVNVADVIEEYEGELAIPFNGEYAKNPIIQMKEPNKIKTKGPDAEKIIKLEKEINKPIIDDTPKYEPISVMPVMDKLPDEGIDLSKVVEEKVNEKLSSLSTIEEKEEPIIVEEEKNIEEPKPIYSFETPTVAKESTLTPTPIWREAVQENNKNNNLSYARSIALNYLDVIDKFTRQYEDPGIGEHQRKALKNGIAKLQLDLGKINEIKQKKLEINDKIAELKAEASECDEELKVCNNEFSDTSAEVAKHAEYGRKADIVLIQQEQSNKEYREKKEALEQQEREAKEKYAKEVENAIGTFEQHLFDVEEKPILSITSPMHEEKEENVTLNELKEFKSELNGIDNSLNNNQDSYFDFNDYLENKSSFRKVA